MRQIKQAGLKGTPILFKPQELVGAAINTGMQFMSDSKTVYWVVKDSVQIAPNGFRSQDTIDQSNPKKPQKGWHAFASGSVKLGKTDTATDRFFEPRLYSFSVEYKSSKDDLGLPDIEVLQADFRKLDPAAAMIFEDKTLSNIPPLSAKVPTAEKLAAKVSEDPVAAAPTPQKVKQQSAPEPK